MKKISKSHSKVKSEKGFLRFENQFLIIKQIAFREKKDVMKIQKDRYSFQKQQNQMSNLALFYAQSQANRHNYPCSFDLIKHLPFTNSKLITLQHLKEPNFPVLSYTVKELIDFSYKIIKSNNFFINYIKNKESMHELIKTLAQNYNPVSYHNFSHGFTLMLMNYQCMEKSENLKKLFSEQEYFYIQMAGLSHDLGHMGNNNQFYIKSNSELAKIVDNSSVLQNMHLRRLWNIIEENPNLNFLKASTDIKKAKKIITRLIISTDMAFHFSGLDNFKQLKSNNQLNLIYDHDHKWIVMQQIFHGCDIGNPCSNYDNYINWAALLSYEFNEQTKLQKEMNIQVTKSFIFTDITSLYKDQVWFLGNIVHPLWKEIADSFPSLHIYPDNVQSNLKRVKEELDRQRP